MKANKLENNFTKTKYMIISNHKAKNKLQPEAIFLK